MTYDEFDTFCDGLPATHRIIQWGGAHVWKVGDKVFAIGGWSKSDKEKSGKKEGQPAFVFKASDLSFQILKDQPGLRSAPYLASRGMKWIQRYDSTAMPDDNLKAYLRQSHTIVASGLTKKKQRELGLLAS